MQHTSLVLESTRDAKCSRSSSPVRWSNLAIRHSTVRPNRGSISRHIAYHGTKFELCSIIVVTTLSPSRKAVSSEYITALCASVVLRYVAMQRRFGAPSHPAMVSKDSSNSSVVLIDAEDWPRCTFS